MTPGEEHRAHVSIEKYVDQRCEALSDALCREVHALDMGIRTYNETMNLRLERMNEFRDAMQDQAGRFVTRTELEAQFLKSATQRQVLVGWFLGGAGLLVAILSFVLRLSGH